MVLSTKVLFLWWLSHFSSFQWYFIYIARNDNNRCLKVLFLNSFYDCIFCVPVKYIFRFSFAGRELGTWLWYWWGAQNVSDDVRKRLREGQLYPACFAPSISAVLINSERLWKERERGGTLRVGIVFTKLGEPGMGRERLKERWQEMSGNDG